MRIDKFLKNSRIIKRRTIANEACDQGRVSVNGRVVKASYEICVGDIIEIRFGSNLFKAEVLEVLEHAPKNAAETMYKITN